MIRLIKSTFVLIPILLVGLNVRAQKTVKEKKQTVVTIGVLDTANYKSGRRINEYYLELSEKDFKKYKGKKIVVKGELMVISGVDPDNKEIVQGSAEERKFILHPKIKFCKR